MTSSSSVVALEGVDVSYSGTRVLQISSLHIGAGERIFVLGRSGSGKTTLSRLIKGRIAPKRGTVHVLGGNPAGRNRNERKRLQRRIAMIDQEFYLVPRLPVIANVLCGALGRVPAWKSVLGIYPTEEWERAESILREVELGGHGMRRIDTLSGGQRQRVAIARALMQEADVILADEPVSNLDPELAEDSLELLVRVTDRRDVTLIVNLHQPRLAKQYATRVIGLHDGKLIFDGDPETLSTESEELIYKSDDDSEDAPDAPTEGVRPHDGPATSMA